MKNENFKLLIVTDFGVLCSVEAIIRKFFWEDEEYQKLWNIITMKNNKLPTSTCTYC